MDSFKGYKYLLLSVVLFVFVFLIFHKVLHIQMDEMYHHESLDTAQALKNKTISLIDSKRQSMLSLAVAISDNVDIKQALIKKDPSLMNLSKISQNLKEYTIYKNVWFQVVDKDGFSFYRSWIDKSGDNLKNIRIDIKKILEDKKVFTSISVGKFDMTFKAMVPIFKGKRFLGIFEIITHFNSIAQTLKEDGIDVAFIVDKKYKKQLTKPLTKIFIDDYYIANYNIDKTLLGTLKTYGVEKFIDTKKEFFVDENKDKLYCSFEIFDINGDVMGYAVISVSSKLIHKDEIDDFHKNSLIYFFSVSIIILLILFFISIKRHSEELESSLELIKIKEEKVHTILDTQPTIIVITDGKTMLEANNTFLSFFDQYSSLEEFKKEYACICDFFVDDIKKEDYITDKEKWLGILLNNPDKVYKVAIDKKEKRYHFVVKARTTKLGTQKDILNVVTFIDITEQIQRDKFLQEQTKMAALGEMIGNIAHQWRQPLSVISTCASGMQLQNEMDSLSAEQIDSNCEMISKNAQYLSKTIDEFRNFMSGSSKKECFNLKSSTEVFFNLIETSRRENDINLISQIDEDIKLVGLKNELNQCLINLFNNSKDIMTTKNIEHRYIKITATKKEDQLLITFQDSGGGISDSIIDKVFEPYFTTKHQSVGTGLGLNITYRLITEGMSGKVYVENEKFIIDDKELFGAKFNIEIPID